MAFALRIDDIVVNANLTVDVFFTAGTPPLASVAAGTKRTYASKAALLAAIKDVDNGGIAQQLGQIVMARAYKQDSSGGAIFRANVVGDMVITDLTKDAFVGVIKDGSYIKPGTDTAVRLLQDWPGVPKGTVLTRNGEWYVGGGLSLHKQFVIDHPEQVGP